MLRRRPREPLVETVLVEDGRIRLFDQHLLRLRRSGASGRQVSGVRALAGTWRATARLPTVVRFEIAAGTGVASRPRPPVPATPVRLALVPGHDPADERRERKLADRAWTLDAEARARAAGADEPLLQGPDGRVGETTRANLFVIDAGGGVATPPVAGLLPGVTRGWVLERTGGVERELSAADVAGARGAFLTTAGRGVVAVAALDGAAIPEHPLIGELARDWRGLR